MDPRKVPFSPPHVGQEEIDEVIGTLRAGWLTTGPKVAQFEQAFADFVGAPAALAVNSCTAALHLSLLVSGVGPGTAVITSPLTFCSGVHVIEHLGAHPVFVDVEPSTMNIDAGEVARILRAGDGRVRARPAGGASESDPLPVAAILPVHYAGQPCDLPVLEGLAADCGVPLVEDAAHALPAAVEGRPVGQVGLDGQTGLTCFSFYATKNLSTGEGGMITGSPELLDRARLWSLHGMTKDAWSRATPGAGSAYDVLFPGYKYNMPDLMGALGLAQLGKLRAMHARRTEIAARYTDGLGDVEGVITPSVAPGRTHAWHLYAVRVDGEAGVPRDDLAAALAERGVSTSMHFQPVHMLSYYRDRYGYVPSDFPVAAQVGASELSLPLHPGMTDDDVDYVVWTVRQAVGKG